MIGLESGVECHSWMGILYLNKHGWLDMAGMEASIESHGSRTKIISGSRF